MIKNKSRFNNVYLFVLPICFLLFTILSWILLFRDKRALTGISYFYPFLHNFLFLTQKFLLSHGLNTIPTFLFAIVAIIACYFYLLSLTKKISIKQTILFAFLFQVILFLSYPILSTDIFSYINLERVSTVHHANIWVTKPSAFSNDAFASLADWKDNTSIYGDIHYSLYLLPDLLGQHNLLTTVILYKFVSILFVLGTMYIIYLLLKLQKSDNSSRDIRLVFWNPLVVLELAGSGHNDSIMIFFSLVSYYFYQKRKWFVAGCVLAFAVQVKLIPVLLCFFLLFHLIRKKAFQDSLKLLLGFIITNIILFLPMQVSFIDYVARVAYNGGVYWQSLPNVLRYFISGGNVIVSLAFVLWFLIFIIRQWKKDTHPLYMYGVALLVYLLFVSSAYWNWYVLWVVALLPFLNDKKIIITTLLFSFTSLLAYPLLWLSLRFGYTLLIWPFLTYVFIFGVPILGYLFLVYRRESVTVFLKLIGMRTLFAEKV